VEVQQELARRSEPVLKELREQVARRQGMVDSLRFVSPAIVTQLALEDVAGAGAPRHQRFEAQVDAYHAQYRAYFFDHIRGGKPFTPSDLDSVPAWEFVEEDTGELTARILGGVFGLLLFALAMIGLAWPGLRRVGRLAR
jgi:ABC-2 type transport system permease protein